MERELVVGNKNLSNCFVFMMDWSFFQVTLKYFYISFHLYLSTRVSSTKDVRI